MAWDKTKPTDGGLLINFPGQARANWDAIELLTDADLKITNAKVAADAAIVESKVTFNGSGHGHADGADGKLIDLTAAITGILDETNGGTGQNTITQGDLLYGSGANTLSKLGFGTSGYFLKTQGIGANPVWAVPTAGGSAGGDLTGTYPNPTIGAGKVDQANWNDDAIPLLNILDVASVGLTEAVILNKVLTSGQLGTINGIRIKGCYKMVVSDNPGASGQLYLRIRMGANGTTSDTQMVVTPSLAGSQSSTTHREFEFVFYNNASDSAQKGAYQIEDISPANYSSSIDTSGVVYVNLTAIKTQSYTATVTIYGITIEFLYRKA